LSFADIVGHEGPKRLLQRAIAGNRVSHAYLFEGPPLVGKTLTARTFAKALMCEAPPAPGDSCGGCAICRAVERGNHPDFLLIRPTSRIELKDETGEKETAEIAGSQITVDAIGRLISDANLKAASARRKVFIVSSAEAMNPPAMNRLLKTLEEPPGTTTIILTTANMGALLPTIISRCQLVRFGPVPVPEVQAALGARFPGSDAGLVRALAALSGGRLGWAERLLQHPDTVAIRCEVLDLAAGLPARPPVYCLKAAETLIDATERWWLATADSEQAKRVLKDHRDRVLRTRIGDLLDILLTWFRDVSLARDGGADDLLINADRAERLRQAGASVPATGPGEAAAAVRRARESIVGNANLRLAVEVMLAEIRQALSPGQ
jgi:DNA polymerase III subunit delta'